MNRSEAFLKTRRLPAVMLVVAMLLAAQTSARAHFLWLVTDAGKLQCYFSEGPHEDDPELLERLGPLSATAGEEATIKLTFDEAELSGRLPTPVPGRIVVQHTYGEFSRGDKSFLLKYVAIAQGAAPASGLKIEDAVLLSVSEVQSDLVVTASLDGKPFAEQELSLHMPDGSVKKMTTDDAGTVKIEGAAAGQYAVRVGHGATGKFESDGKTYDQMRVYTTLTYALTPSEPKGDALPDLPEAITSFGAAILDNAVYTYGGHCGDAHSYHREAQSTTLHRLKLSDPEKWEAIATGPNLQGLALVAHGQSLYRLGGFSAKNADGEEHDLWSQTSAARFDIGDQNWHAMPDLPEPRSSMDAITVGDWLYVAGGWSMQGKDSKSKWHDTAWRLNLKESDAKWQAIAKPPFQRRAVALAAFKGRLWVLGGMKSEGGPSTRVDIYDPAKDQWTEGPKILGEAMAGFGCAAFETLGNLYVSTVEGTLQRLSEDESRWEKDGELVVGRFFHRMLPASPGHFLMIGGANMEIGKFAEVERIDVGKQ